MSTIRNISIQDLSEALAAEDFDLLSFVPSNLSEIENQKAMEVMAEYAGKIIPEMSVFLDLYEKKKKTQQQIDELKEKVKLGCGGWVGLYFCLAFLLMILLAMIAPLKFEKIFWICLIAPFFLVKKAGLLFTDKRKLEKLESLKQHFASIQRQIKETIKKMGYVATAEENSILSDIHFSYEHFSEVVSLLEKRAVILNDKSLTPTACLLAIEQLNNAIRQDKHNKEMQKATYGAAERIANEVARQEETNRMVNAFLAGFTHSRNK